jgi:hypothetical protein
MRNEKKSIGINEVRINWKRGEENVGERINWWKGNN